MKRQDEAWQEEHLVQTFLEGVRGGLPLVQAQLDTMLHIIKHNGGVRHFMDLGCGNGILSAAILAHYPDATGILLDFSEPMLQQAQEQLSSYGPRLQFILDDLASPEWSSTVASAGAFDLIVTGYAIHHQPDQRKHALYREIFSLLAPRGLFINTEHVSSPTPWLEELWDEYLIDSLHSFSQQRGSDKTREQITHEYVHRPDKVANILTPVELQCQWLREIGYADVDCYLKVFELAQFGGRRPPDC